METPTKHQDRPKTIEELRKERKEALNNIGQFFNNMLASLILFMIEACLISWVWNHIVIDTVSALVILPFVTPLQVGAFKVIKNYLLPS